MNCIIKMWTGLKLLMVETFGLITGLTLLVNTITEHMHRGRLIFKFGDTASKKRRGEH